MSNTYQVANVREFTFPGFVQFMPLLGVLTMKTKIKAGCTLGSKVQIIRFFVGIFRKIRLICDRLYRKSLYRYETNIQHW